MSIEPSHDSYIVAGSKPWNRRVFDEVIARYPGQWRYVASRDALTPSLLEQVQPRYVFFLHWSWKVPEDVISRYECVCFHMTDVPYGRGGTPLQNLIVRGHSVTKLTALRMVGEFDAGPVYLKRELSLEGTAEAIYVRMTRLAAEMILQIVSEHPAPVPQTGEPVLFSRRKPEESAIRGVRSLESLYDVIRMLDADGYPRAFLDHDGFRYELSRAALYDGRIVADVTITPSPEPGS